MTASSVQADGFIPDRRWSPRGAPLIGHAWYFRENPFGLLMGLMRQQGEIARFRLPMFNGYLLSNAEAVAHVLTQHPDNHPRSPLYQRVTPFFGKGLITTEGDLWRRQRKMVNPSFSRDKLQALIAPMRAAASRYADGLMSPGAAHYATINVVRDMTDLTLSIVFETLFGWPLGAAEAGDLSGYAVDMWTRLYERAISALPLPMSVPTPANIMLRRSISAIEKTVHKMIAARRARPVDDGSLLSLLIAARSKEGEKLPDDEIRDHILTFIIAGHETTSNTVSWALYLLARHPGWIALIRAEADSGAGWDGLMSFDPRAASAVKMVVNETLRIYPPVWAIDRSVTEDDEICGVKMAAGSVLLLSPYTTHRNPRYWPDPERFDPMRFANGQPQQAYRFFPFGGGGHRCIGERFALIESQVILLELLSRYRISPASSAPVEPQPLLTTRPKDNCILLNFTPR